MDDLRDTTQIRIIRSEARHAILGEKRDILDAVDRLGVRLTAEIREHFATKTDLTNWKLEMHDHIEKRTQKVIDEHVRRDHRPSLVPGGPYEPRPRMTRGQKAGVWGGAGGAILAIVYAIVEFLAKK
jgi:hypothetical protein